MPDLPPHTSPALAPLTSPQSDQLPRAPLSLSRPPDRDIPGLRHLPPGSLISPAVTPPSTPVSDPPGAPPKTRAAKFHPVDTSQDPAPELLPQLPQVSCVVRTRIPTTFGRDMWLHLYQNDIDSKEHLAIVFGNSIRSKSLFALRPGETERDRIIRGAYEGRLHPGRTSSGFDRAAGASTGASPLLKSLHKPNLSGTSSASVTQEPPNPSTNRSDKEFGPLSSSTLPAAPKAEHQSVKQHDELPPSLAPLVRIHSECYTGETVWSARCDCGEQLDEAARLMSLPSSNNPGGVIVYLRQEGRGIGLSEKLKAYNLQDLGSDTVEANLLLRHPADARSYGLATAMLLDLGLGRPNLESRSDESLSKEKVTPDEEGPGIRLLTNNPDKVRAVEGPNREVVVRERVEMVPLAWSSGGARGVNSDEVGNYMKTKVRILSPVLLSCCTC